MIGTRNDRDGDVQGSESFDRQFPFAQDMESRSESQGSRGESQGRLATRGESQGRRQPNPRGGRSSLDRPAYGASVSKPRPQDIESHIVPNLAVQTEEVRAARSQNEESSHRRRGYFPCCCFFPTPSPVPSPSCSPRENGDEVDRLKSIINKMERRLVELEDAAAEAATRKKADDGVVDALLTQEPVPKSIEAGQKKDVPKSPAIKRAEQHQEQVAVLMASTLELKAFLENEGLSKPAIRKLQNFGVETMADLTDEFLVNDETLRDEIGLTTAEIEHLNASLASRATEKRQHKKETTETSVQEEPRSTPPVFVDCRPKDPSQLVTQAKINAFFAPRNTTTTTTTTVAAAARQTESNDAAKPVAPKGSGEKLASKELANGQSPENRDSLFHCAGGVVTNKIGMNDENGDAKIKNKHAQNQDEVAHEKTIVEVESFTIENDETDAIDFPAAEDADADASEDKGAKQLLQTAEAQAEITVALAKAQANEIFAKEQAEEALKIAEETAAEAQADDAVAAKKLAEAEEALRVAEETAAEAQADEVAVREQAEAEKALRIAEEAEAEKALRIAEEAAAEAHADVVVAEEQAEEALEIAIAEEAAAEAQTDEVAAKEQAEAEEALRIAENAAAAEEYAEEEEEEVRGAVSKKKASVLMSESEEQEQADYESVANADALEPPGPSKAQKKRIQKKRADARKKAERVAGGGGTEDEDEKEAASDAESSFEGEALSFESAAAVLNAATKLSKAKKKREQKKRADARKSADGSSLSPSGPGEGNEAKL